MRREWSACRKILWFPSDDECNFQNAYLCYGIPMHGKRIKKLTGLSVHYSCVVHHFAPTFEIDLFGCVAYYIIQKSPVRSDPAISTWMINGSVCLFIHGQIIRKSCRRQFSSSLCLSRPVTPLSSYLINQLIKGDQLSMSVAITFSIFLYKI